MTLESSHLRVRIGIQNHQSSARELVQTVAAWVQGNCGPCQRGPVADVEKEPTVPKEAGGGRPGIMQSFVSRPCPARIKALAFTL